MSIIKVKTGGITADAITDALIADDVVGTEHLTANEVDTTALGADAVTAAQIADDAVSDEHLDVTSITGQTAETSVADGDTILIHDASASALRKMTKANFVSGVGETNTPYFCAKPTGSSQVFTHNSDTKMTFNAEVFDSADAFDHSTNYRFTPQTAGKYFVFLRISGTGTNNDEIYMEQSLRKNGTRFEQLVGIHDLAQGDFEFGSLTAMVEMNGSSDYLEAYAYFYNYTNSSRNISVYGGEKTKFGAFLVSTA